MLLSQFPPGGITRVLIGVLIAHRPALAYGPRLPPLRSLPLLSPALPSPPLLSLYLLSPQPQPLQTDTLRCLRGRCVPLP